MKRQVITIQEDMVIYAPHHGEVWMTVWEIAELLNVTGTAVKNTIKRIWKQSVLKDFQHSQYVKLENGYSAHVYDMQGRRIKLRCPPKVLTGTLHPSLPSIFSG